jgi:DNA invertase Pin-like site-specific DNA recombinase
MKVRYARVSTHEQNLEMQIQALTDALGDIAAGGRLYGPKS